MALCIRRVSVLGGNFGSTARVPANQRLKLTGAAILVSRGLKVLQAAPAA
jgi:hypothetical protein